QYSCEHASKPVHFALSLERVSRRQNTRRLDACCRLVLCDRQRSRAEPLPGARSSSSRRTCRGLTEARAALCNSSRRSFPLLQSRFQNLRHPGQRGLKSPPAKVLAFLTE